MVCWTFLEGKIDMRLWWNLIRQGASLLFITELSSSNTPRCEHTSTWGKVLLTDTSRARTDLWPPLTRPSSSLSHTHVLTHGTHNTHISCTRFLPSGILRDGREVENVKKAWKSRADVSWQDGKDGSSLGPAVVSAKLMIRLQNFVFSPLLKNILSLEISTWFV